MTEFVNYPKMFSDQMLRYKEQLIVAIDQSTDESQRQEILSGIDKLTEYETIILQRFDLLLAIDPEINRELVHKSGDLIHKILRGFVADGFINKVEVDKFINFRPIENYTI
jgi:hypothetical protein